MVSYRFFFVIYLFIFQIIASTNILFRIVDKKICSCLNHITDIGKIERNIWIILYLKNDNIW